METNKRIKNIIYTLGHAELSFDAFIEPLRKNGIHTLVDVRTIPRSKPAPHFNHSELIEKMPTFGITYHHIKELGGRGHSGLRRSPNTGLSKTWQVYADHMLTEDFERGLNQLLALASIGSVAIFCSELDWNKCHRRFLADVLTIRGIGVVHLIPPSSRMEHVKTLGIEVKKGRITYPAAGEQLSLF